MTPQIDLSGLKGLHFPPEPSFFPPAWGWWVIAVFLLCFFLILFFIINRIISAPKYYALRELDRLQNEIKNPVLLGREISKLLKRIVLIRFPNERLATLSAEEWESFLKNRLPDVFSSQQANFIAFSTFLPDNKVKIVDVKALTDQTRLWIKRIFKGKNNGNQNR